MPAVLSRKYRLNRINAIKWCICNWNATKPRNYRNVSMSVSAVSERSGGQGDSTHCDRDPLVCLTFTCKQHHPTHRAWETAERHTHTTQRARALPIYSLPGPKQKQASRACLRQLYTPNRKCVSTYGRCTGFPRSRSSTRDSSTHGVGIHTHSAWGKSSANQQLFPGKHWTNELLMCQQSWPETIYELYSLCRQFSMMTIVLSK